MFKFIEKLGGSLLFGFILLILGFLIEISTSIKIYAPEYPKNLILLLSFAIALICIHVFFQKTRIVKWLSSVNIALSAIIFYTGLTILMGLIPQVKTTNVFIETLGLNRITTTWTYLILLIFFSISLGFVTLKRLTPINRKNIGFFFNHFGLWLVILSANLGVGDLHQMNMIIREGETEIEAMDKDGFLYKMPIAVHLNDFDIEEFNPKLLIYNNKSFDLVSKPYLIDTLQNSFSFNEYKIEVKTFYKSSFLNSNNFEPKNDVGNCPSAYIEITKNNKIVSEGWVSCGSFTIKKQILIVDSLHTLIMSNPEPKRFYSDVKLYTQAKEELHTVIEVNNPVKFLGWTIYQTSYDSSKGRWSNYTVLEFVKDPWLPVVYFGIFLMIIGVGFIIFRGEDLNH